MVGGVSPQVGTGLIPFATAVIIGAQVKSGSSYFASPGFEVGHISPIGQVAGTDEF